MGIGHYNCYLLEYSLDLGISQLLGFRLSLCVSGLDALANSTNLWVALCGNLSLILVVCCAASWEYGSELLSLGRTLGDDNAFVRRFDRDSNQATGLAGRRTGSGGHLRNIRVHALLVYYSHCSSTLASWLA